MDTASFATMQRPRMLKDYLTEDLNSTHLKKSSSFRLLRSKSKAASKTISVIQKYLRWSIGSKRRNNDVREVLGTVKVKDILRWRSFRDLVEEKAQPLDLSSSPNRCTTITTTTGSTHSSRSSWCDSDFTSEDLPFWCGENEVGHRKKLLLGERDHDDSTEDMEDPKVEVLCEEKDQHSPVSVFDFSFQEDEESLSFSHQRVAKLEPIKLDKRFSTEKNTHFEEEAEDKAQQLLNTVKTTSSAENDRELSSVDHHLIMDFFRHELTTCKEQRLVHDIDYSHCEMLRMANAWVSREEDGCLEWEIGGNKEVCMRDMDITWNKVEKEQELVVLEMESEILTYLVDELLVDLH